MAIADVEHSDRTADEHPWGDPSRTEEFVDSLLDSLGELVEDAAACGALGCRRDDELHRVKHPERGTRVLCPSHALDYLGVSP